MYSPAKVISHDNLGDGVDGGAFEKNNQFNGAIIGEMAAQKSKFNRKFKETEKIIDHLKSEKAQLTQVLDT